MQINSYELMVIRVPFGLVPSSIIVKSIRGTGAKRGSSSNRICGTYYLVLDRWYTTHTASLGPHIRFHLELDLRFNIM